MVRERVPVQVGGRKNASADFALQSLPTNFKIHKIHVKSQTVHTHKIL